MEKKASRIAATEPVVGIKCRSCGEDLYPCPTEHSLSFMCLRGHLLGLKDLARDQDSRLQFVVEVTLQSWELSLRDMERAAADATIKGIHGLAQMYFKQIGRMQARIDIVRAAVRNGHPD